MKIQPISTYNYKKISFKENDKKDYYDCDYGTYYNNMTMKDALISAGIVSSICYIGTQALLHEEKIKKFFIKIIKKVL